MKFCDVCWNLNIFQCLSFLKRGKNFWATSLHHLHPNWNGIQFSWSVPHFEVNDGRVSKSIDSLEHLSNVACVSQFYSYYNGFCLSKITGLIPVNYVFPCSTRHSWRAHSYVVDWPLHNRKNSFSSHTICSLRAEIVIFGFFLKDIKYRKSSSRMSANNFNIQYLTPSYY